MNPNSFFAFVSLVAVVTVVNTWFSVGSSSGQHMEEYDI